MALDKDPNLVNFSFEKVANNILTGCLTKIKGLSYTVFVQVYHCVFYSIASLKKTSNQFLIVDPKAVTATT